ncbi:hypothetical protein AK51_20850 [Serratia nematodiphila DZ0503SBS1]|nr:hypothetical protein AK51_20850 [Serratia nematodiphila DZ0503SBS1]
MKATGATGDGTQAGDVNYAISGTRFTTQGYRDHSAARKNLGNGKLGVRLDDVSTLTLMFNSVSIDAGDPGGLTEAEWKENPRQARARINTTPASRSIRPRPACAISAR